MVKKKYRPRLYKKLLSLFFVLLLITACSTSTPKSNDNAEIKRGRYLVVIMGCNDCHTSDSIGGGSLPPDDDWLVGGTRGFYGPWGTVYPANLRLLLNDITEDAWLAMARKMRSNSPMAWSWLPNATDTDLLAIYRFVKFLGPKGEPAPQSLPPGTLPETDYITFPLPH